MKITDGRYDAGAWIEFHFNLFWRLCITRLQIYRLNIFFVPNISRQTNCMKIFDNFSFVALTDRVCFGIDDEHFLLVIRLVGMMPQSFLRSFSMLFCRCQTKFGAHIRYKM